MCLAWAIKEGFKDDQKKNCYSSFSCNYFPAIVDVGRLVVHTKKENGRGYCR